MAKQNNRNSQNKNPQRISLIISIIAIVAVGVIYFNKDKILNQGNSDSGSKTVAQAVQNENGDLVIPVSGVSETASFYKVNIDTTDVEVLAIKASDGTIRTAFNTCQVCFDSGRGYYEQSGDRLVCQNCGNQFTADDVEVARGGCNPIPIDEANKQVDEDNITISAAYLNEAKTVFENWKTN